MTLSPKRAPLPLSPQPQMIKQVDRILHSLYGRDEGSRDVGDPLDGLILTILSQNTSDSNSDRAFQRLKAVFPLWEAVLEAERERIEEAIRPGGMATVRSRRIKEVLGIIKERLGGLDLYLLKERSDQELLEFFTSLPGVGLKTASVVLLFYFGRPFFPVDTHVHRVGVRLGWIPPGSSSERAHAILGEAIPHELKARLHLNLIAHGRKICRPSRPRCEGCPLTGCCMKVGVRQEG